MNSHCAVNMRQAVDSICQYLGPNVMKSMTPYIATDAGTDDADTDTDTDDDKWDEDHRALCTTVLSLTDLKQLPTSLRVIILDYSLSRHSLADIYHIGHLWQIVTHVGLPLLQTKFSDVGSVGVYNHAWPPSHY
jgi:hypothetical protein